MEKRIVLIVMVLFSSMSCSDLRSGKTGPSAGVYSDETREVLGRGIISFRNDRGHVFLSWRLLPLDPKGSSFDIYRKEIGEDDSRYRWIARTDRTSFRDEDARGRRFAYAVRTVHEGREGELSGESIPLSSVNGKPGLVFDIGQSFEQARVVTGDLDGDGNREVVVAYSGYQNVDPYEKAWSRSGDTVKVAAFLPTGKRMWTLDLGSGIESGAMYQPMVVWDLDGNGKAEVILKTNKSDDPLDYEKERITVIDGMTGETLKEAQWPSPPWSPDRRISGPIADLPKGIWADYNNDSRNYLAIAHLDGTTPYVIAARGIYKSQKIWALDKDLRRVWERNLGLDHITSEGFPYTPLSFRDRLTKFWSTDGKWKHLLARFTGKPSADQYRGTHSLPVADLDNDGKEEILWGERCIGEKGADLWAIKEKIPYPGHPDIVFAADILPSREGKEIFFGREGGVGESDKIGAYLADSRGRVLWAHWGYHHIDKGWVSKIIADQEGLQCLAIDIVEKKHRKAGPWKVIEPVGLLWGSDGKLLGNPPADWYKGFPVDWDGDGTREICSMVNGEIRKYGGTLVEKLVKDSLWGADLFGDHREEIVAAPGDGKIYIFVNAGIPDSEPRITPLADRQYKNDLSRTAMQGLITPTEGGFNPGR